MKVFTRTLFIALIILAMPTKAADTSYFELGANLFIQYCTLCHGSQGMGDGLLPIKLDEYPGVNLLRKIKAKTRADLFSVINLGSQRKDISAYMPPWEDELSRSQVKLLVNFILKLRANTEETLKILAKQADKKVASESSGRLIYRARCVLCHGDTGKGDGRMARIIKNPSPADLTASRLAAASLTQIISGGGKAVKRSPQMPPWKDQLSKPEIAAVISYIQSIRN